MQTIKICGWRGQLEEHGLNKRHKDGLANGCKKCRSDAQRKYHKEGGGRAAAKTRRDAAKIAAFEAYGGCTCVGCNEKDLTVLSIDHINGGGNKHRQEIKGKFLNLYFWLKSNNYPPGYRVLCMNCQFRAKVGMPLPLEVK